MRVELPGEGEGGRKKERLIWNSNKIRFRRDRKEKKSGEDYGSGGGITPKREKRCLQTPKSTTRGEGKRAICLIHPTHKRETIDIPKHSVRSKLSKYLLFKKPGST